EMAGFDEVESADPMRPVYTPHQWGVDDKLIFDQAQKWLQAAKDRSQMIVLISSMTHYPYLAPLPREFATELKPPAGTIPGDTDFDRYTRLLAYNDHQIAEFYR